ncbi:MAG TPA: CpsD/CapB family tyrosine-protein kinase, partial [Pyrinomonadaceae bacterium]|nr:CpsD/CapB family tyrosine-protein kinase [Pyrinomonadaceae bacterium]
KRAAETNGAKAKGNGAEPEAKAQAEVEKGLAPTAVAPPPPNGHHEGAQDVAATAVTASPANGSRAAGSSPASPTAAASPDFLFQSSRHFNAPEAAHVSASNEHTGTPAGSALSGGQASRAAGATLGAAGSTRTPEFVSFDISAARVEPHLVAVTQPRSGHAERFRSLRTRLLHAGERKKMQAFVITSAGIMEGKTLTAVNLSWLLAQTDGVRALLIDGDLRNPCCADYFGLDAPTGLSEVLGGEVSLAEAIIKLEPAGLHLLPGGSVRDDVAELLSGPKFSAVLAEARRMFDYVIIDAPPLAVFTDATVLINRADAALIVARAGQTRYAALERVLAPVPRERILGVILNGSEEQMNEQNYYYRRYKTRRDAGGEAE